MAGGARKWARVSKMGARNLGLDRLGLGDGLYLSTHPENPLFSHFTISNFADDITITCREIPTLSDTSRDLQDFAEAQHSHFTTISHQPTSPSTALQSSSQQPQHHDMSSDSMLKDS